MHQYKQRLTIDHRQQLKARPTQTQCSLMQQMMWQVPTAKLVYSFKEKNLRLQVPSFAHGYNISPTTNYLNIKYQFNIRRSVQNQNEENVLPGMVNHKEGTIYKRWIYLDSFIIIHNPPFMVMTIGKAMVMLPVVANLNVTEKISEIWSKNWFPINRVLFNQLKSYIENICSNNQGNLDIQVDT